MEGVKSKASPSALWKRFHKSLRAGVLSLSLALVGLVIVPLLLLLLPLRMLAPPVWYWSVHLLVGQLFAVCIVACEVFGALKVNICGDAPKRGEQLVVIANRVSALDWIVILGCAARYGALHNFQLVGQMAPLSRVPMAGLALWLQRKACDPGDLVRYCTPVWICVFPETRRQLLKGVEPVLTESAEATVEAASDRVPAPSKYLRPRLVGSYKNLRKPQYDALQTVLDGARPQVKHALDVTLVYESTRLTGQGPSLFEGLFSSAAVSVDVFVQRVELPLHGEDASAWLDGRWADKDATLEEWKGLGVQDSWFATKQYTYAPLRLVPLLGGFFFYLLPYLVLVAAGIGALLLRDEISEAVQKSMQSMPKPAE